MQHTMRVARLDHIEAPGVPVRHVDLAAVAELYPEAEEWFEELQAWRDVVHESKIIPHGKWVQLKEELLSFLDDVEEEDLSSPFLPTDIKHLRREIDNV